MPESSRKMSVSTWVQNDSDNYSTTRAVWRALLDHRERSKIYDPCFFDGTAARLIASLGHLPVHECKDFFNPQFVVPTYDILATNPPFSNPLPFLRRIVDLTIANGKPFAVLLPVATRSATTSRFSSVGSHLLDRWWRSNCCRWAVLGRFSSALIILQLERAVERIGSSTECR